MRQLKIFIVGVVFVDRIISGHHKSAQVFDSVAKFSYVVFALERFGLFNMDGTEGLNPQEAVMVVESVCQNRQGVQLAWNFFKAALWICNNLFPDPFF
jgi:hypothetical protein